MMDAASSPSQFKDHFSGHASVYADFRPHYPAELFALLADQSVARDAVWDAGCGNGQASVGLAKHFTKVYATDASAEQIAAALQNPHIDYRVAPAEASGLADASVDAIIVCQALHWFDFDQFYAEARRVGRSGAPIFAVAYELAEISAPIDAIIRDFYKADIGPYWPADRAHIETGYRDIPWSFTPLDLPPVHMSAQWSLDQMMGYTSTWSAVRRYQSATGIDPVPALREALAPQWGDGRREINWPLVIKSGRI